MADTPGFRRRVTLVMMLALLVASLDVARLLTYDDGERQPSAAPPVSLPAIEPPTTIAAPVTPAGTDGGSPTLAPAALTGADASAGATVVEPDPPAPPAAPTTTVPTVKVTCASDLSLADSPDAPYNFLCVQDGVPITWPDDNIRLYSSGLSPEQSAALQVALPQWEDQGRFRVTEVDSAGAANLTLTTAVLDNAEDGHALVHYTCLATCAFDHVDMVLSSTRELTKPLWVTTILHELGHAAGLNHVSRKTQVMYCELDLLSPSVYSDGDLAGLQELAGIRSS